MYIFYDLETSSKELIGQILSYSFIVVTNKFEITSELNGTIRLNRTQLPDLEAILTNKILIVQHQQQAESEYQAAKKIHDFLAQMVDTHGYIPLTGFNSNSFDLNFLRNLLTRYGFNPYFKGKLTNLDILHFAWHVAFENAATFLWQLTENENGINHYSFKLETLAKQFDLLSQTQSHDAREDVLLTIALAKKLSKQYKIPFKAFKPVQITDSTVYEGHEIGKQKVCDYPNEPREPQKYKYKFWCKITETKKESIWIDLEKYPADSPEECLRYINPNKHFFILEKLTEEEKNKFEQTIQKINQDSYLKQITPSQYFELIKKEVDIEYQIFELGFDHIDKLKPLVTALMQDPSTYQPNLAQLLTERKEKKDNYLIQLFNRIYLNYHPNPAIEHLHRYLIPRYITCEMVRNNQDTKTLADRAKQLEILLAYTEESNPTYPLLKSYKSYFDEFCRINHLEKWIN